MTNPPVTLDQFAEHLNLGATPAPDSPERLELQMHLDAATEAIENRVGPLVTRVVTERGTVGAGGLLVLGNTPVIELTTVTGVRGAIDWDVETLHVDGDGVVGRLYGAWFPRGDYDVEYTAGRGEIANVPARFKLAVLITAAHLFETQRGRGVRPDRWGAQPNPEDAGTGRTPRGFALPKRALELLSGDEEIAFA